MLSQINTAGALYLATKALVRKTTSDIVESSKTTRYAGYVDVVASSLTNVGLVAGTLLMPAISGPVGIALGLKDAWLHRQQIRDGAIATHAWIGAKLHKPKGGTLAAMKDWRDRSRAAREEAMA